MTAYRLYCLDGAGHISLADWIEAASDAEALAEARQLKKDALQCEVWQGDRLVGSLDKHAIRHGPTPLSQLRRESGQCQPGHPGHR